MNFEKPYADSQANTSSTYAAPVATNASGGTQRSARKSMVVRNDSNKLGAVILDVSASENRAFSIEDDHSAPTITGRRIW